MLKMLLSNKRSFKLGLVQHELSSDMTNNKYIKNHEAENLHEATNNQNLATCQMIKTGSQDLWPNINS